MENIDLIIEQISLNPHHNFLFPYDLQSDNYLNSLHSNLSNHFKQLNRKKGISFWYSDSAFAHIWFILIVNCKWVWTQHYSQKNLRTHQPCFWMKYNPLNFFCSNLSEIPFFNLQDSTIILLQQLETEVSRSDIIY